MRVSPGTRFQEAVAEWSDSDDLDESEEQKPPELKAVRVDSALIASADAHAEGLRLGFGQLQKALYRVRDSLSIRLDIEIRD